MYRVAAAVALALTLVLVACGNYSPNYGPNSLTGSWGETLTASSGVILGSLAFNITQNNTTLTFSNLDLSGIGLLTPCFGAGSTLSGQLGTSIANSTGVKMTLSWTDPGGGVDTMTMQGSVANGMGSGSGNFTLAGQTSGCKNQSGGFSMSESGSNNGGYGGYGGYLY